MGNAASAPYTRRVYGRPEYPWQLELPTWTSRTKLSETERRRRSCEDVFESAEVFSEGGSPDPHGLVYDAEADLYRFPDGGFAFFRKHADWRRLKEIGYFSEWGMVGRSKIPHLHAVCNDIGPPSLPLLGTGVRGVPMRSLSLSRVGVTEVAQPQ